MFTLVGLSSPGLLISQATAIGGIVEHCVVGTKAGFLGVAQSTLVLQVPGRKNPSLLSAYFLMPSGGCFVCYLKPARLWAFCVVGLLWPRLHCTHYQALTGCVASASVW